MIDDVLLQGANFTKDAVPVSALIDDEQSCQLATIALAVPFFTLVLDGDFIITLKTTFSTSTAQPIGVCLGNWSSSYLDAPVPIKATIFFPSARRSTRCHIEGRK